LLGVELGASAADIKAAFRRRIQALHVDKFGGENSLLTNMTRDLNIARGILLAELERPVVNASTVGTAAHSGLPGRDEETDITLSFLKALRGGRLTVAVPRGDQTVIVRWSVPVGTRAGDRIRLAGVGGPGQPPGDLYLRIASIEAHPVWSFLSNELDLSMSLRVKYSSIYAGRLVPVRTPWDSGTTSLQLQDRNFGPYRIAGHGARRGDLRGDLVVYLEIEWPPHGDPELIAVLQRLQGL